MAYQESYEQQAFFMWAAYAASHYPGLELMHAISNGGKRDAREAARLKREGVKAGIPDIFLPVTQGIYAGLYIEMKSEKGRLSPAQRDMLQELKAQGYAVCVCRGCEEAVGAIKDYYQGKSMEG